MIDLITRLSKHSFIYTVGSMAVLLPGFILVPVYTKNLSPAEYGIVSIITILIGVLTFIYELGMVGALTRHYYEYDTEEMRKRVISTTFIFLIAWSAILSTALAFGAGGLSRIMLGDPKYGNIITMSLGIVLMGSVIFVPQTVLRLEEKSLLFILLALLRVVLTVFFTVIYISYLHKGLEGVFMAMLVSTMVSAGVYMACSHKHIAFSLFSFVDLKVMLKFGLAFFPASFFTWVIDYSNRYTLSLFASMGDVGIYSLGYKISQVIMILVKAFYLAWIPIMFSIASREDAKKIFSRVLTYFIFFMFSITLGISLFSKEIVLVLSNEKYLEAYKVIPIIAFSGIGYGIYLYLMTGLMVVKKVLSQPFILGFAALANIAFNIFFIRSYGIMGAAAATVATYILVAGLTYLFAQKYYRIEYEFLRLIKIAGSFALVCTLHMLLAGRLSWASPWVLNPLFFASFFVILYASGFFRKGEIGLLKKVLYRKG